MCLYIQFIVFKFVNLAIMHIAIILISINIAHAYTYRNKISIMMDETRMQ